MVMVGQQWGIFDNAKTLPPGIILFKTVNDIQARSMARFRAHGHFVTATDEEALSCIEDTCFMEAFRAPAAENCDLFFAQNAPHRDAVERRFPNLKGKVEIAGNPRVDFLSPGGRTPLMEEANSYRERHGPYILFNTNYASVNSIWADVNQVASIAVKVGVLDPKDPKSMGNFKGLLDWELGNLHALVDLIRWSAINLPHYNLVVRPHPAERLAFWEENIGGLARTTIIPRSNPYPWMLGTDLLVHTGCTTGLEAALMDIPVINLMTSNMPYFDRLIGHVNPTFNRWEDASAAMAEYFSSRSGPVVSHATQYRETLARYFPDYRDAQACASIAKSLVNVFQQRGVQPGGKIRMREGSPFRAIALNDVQREKMTVSLNELTAKYESLRAISGCRRRVNVAQVTESLFILEPADYPPMSA